MNKNGLTLSLFLMIFSTDVMESVANLLMKMGLNQSGITYVGLSNIIDVMLRSASSYMIWLGIVCYLLTFFIWIGILSRVELSIAYPISSASYILVPLLAMFYLHESVGILQWLGIALIIAGIYFISRSKVGDVA